MSTHLRTWILGCSVVALLFPTTVTAAGDESRPPNILFLFVDDLGWGDLGVFYQNQSRHDRRHHTPRLDRMAHEGIQLRAHYCPAPVCAPSRASLLTGVHQGHAEVRDNQFDKMLADNHTVASVLRAAGYATAIIGKYGLQGDGEDPESWPGYPTKRGFDEFYGYVRHRDGHLHYPADHWPLGDSENHREPKQVWHNGQEVSAGLKTCYTTDLFAAKAKDWMIRHQAESPDQPFFLYLAYDTPHAALQVPSVPYPSGSGVEGGIQWLGQPGRMINTAEGEIDAYRHPDYLGHGWSDVEERFATMVRRIDDTVGDLLDTLEDLGIAENTLVVFTSDNGPHHESYLAGKSYDPTSFRSYGKFEGTKRDTWEGGIRVPTLAWWPGSIPARRIDEAPSQFHDWCATFADVAGAVAPARSDGVSLVPTLTGQDSQRPSQVYVEYLNNGATREYEDFDIGRRKRKRGQSQAIFLDGYKGVRVDIQGHADDFEIYDLRADPRERKNLAGTSTALAELQQRMKDRVLQIRRPNASAPRPYDDHPVPSVEIADVIPGLRVDFFPGEFPYVPDMRGREPGATRVVSGLAETLAPETVSGPGAAQWHGWIRIDEPGEYTFRLRSGGGAFLRIHDAAIADGDFGVSPDQWVTGTVRLAEGYHPVRLTARVGGDDRNPPDLQWAQEDGPMVAIPDRVWRSQKPTAEG